MLNRKRTDGNKLIHLLRFIAVNGLSCLVIPFVLDYAHNFINGIIIPRKLLWDDTNQIRTIRMEGYTILLLMVIVEFTGLFGILYQFNQGNTLTWLSERPTPTTRFVTWLTIVVVAIITLFGRDGFLIWLVKHYIKTVI